MSLVLYRFPMSHYSEKVRLALDFKGLEYQLVNLQPGTGQLAVLEKTGQRMVPMLEHDGSFVHDSTAILLYLEHAFAPSAGYRALLPSDLAMRRAAIELEEHLDTTLGRHEPVVGVDHGLRDGQYLEGLATGLLPWKSLNRVGAKLFSALLRPSVIAGPGRTRIDLAWKTVRETLNELCERLAKTPYLLGAEPSMADVAAAGLTHHVYLPAGRHLAAPSLADTGVTGLLNDPVLGRFFDWKRKFYRDFSR